MRARVAVGRRSGLLLSHLYHPRPDTQMQVTDLVRATSSVRPRLYAQLQHVYRPIERWPTRTKPYVLAQRRLLGSRHDGPHQTQGPSKQKKGRPYSEAFDAIEHEVAHATHAALTAYDILFIATWASIFFAAVFAFIFRRDEPSYPERPCRLIDIEILSPKMVIVHLEYDGKSQAI